MSTVRFFCSRVPGGRCVQRAMPALLLALLLCPIPAPAQTSSGVSFTDALRLADERAPMLAARQSRLDAARELAARAAALPDPQLKLGIANWPVTGGDAFDFRADDMTMRQVGVMQAFPARAKRRARQAVADRSIDQARALSVTERLAVRQAAARAWLALWAGQHEVVALHAQREPASVAVVTARARMQGGSGSATDALAAQAAILELENRIDAAEAAVEAAHAELARWLGDIGTAVGDPPDLQTLPVDAPTLLATLDRHAPLLPWQAREAVAEAEIDSAIAGKRPDWRLGMSYGRRERAPAGHPRSDMLMLEFAIDLPLFPGNRQDRDVAARRAELDAVTSEREDARRAQAAAVRRALAEWRSLRRQVERIENEQLPLARDRSRTALAAYSGGAGLQAWLDARRDEIELHVLHAHHLGELGRAWAELAYQLPEENLLQEEVLP